MNIIWLGCGALAVIIVAFGALATRKKEEPKISSLAMPLIVDVKVSFFGVNSGLHGTVKDLNGVFTNAGKDDVQEGEIIRAINKGMKDGLYQFEAIKLSHLEAGQVVATGEEEISNLPNRKGEKEGFVCMYPNEHGFARVGYIKTRLPLKANKKYAVNKESDGVFTLA